MHHPRHTPKVKIDGLGFEASELFDKIQAAKTDKLNCIELLTFAGAASFAAKLAQSADVLNVDPFTIWAYDAPASLSLLPSNAAVNVETHHEPAILNCAIVVESGEGKTRAANLVLFHLRQLEKQARQQYELELTTWKQEEAAAKKEKEAFTEPPPRLEKAIAEVATVQALLRRLHGKERGLLWARDELKGLFSSLGQFCQGESEDREISCFTFPSSCPTAGKPPPLNWLTSIRAISTGLRIHSNPVPPSACLRKPKSFLTPKPKSYS